MKLNHRLRVSIVGGFLHCERCGRRVVARTVYRSGQYGTRFEHVRPYEPGMVMPEAE